MIGHVSVSVRGSCRYWQKIPAGNNYSSLVLLDLPYEFPLGKYRYNIGSIEYFVVNNEWFIDQWIYKSFFPY